MTPSAPVDYPINVVGVDAVLFSDFLRAQNAVKLSNLIDVSFCEFATPLSRSVRNGPMYNFIRSVFFGACPSDMVRVNAFAVPAFMRCMCSPAPRSIYPCAHMSSNSPALAIHQNPWAFLFACGSVRPINAFIAFVVDKRLEKFYCFSTRPFNHIGVAVSKVTSVMLDTKPLAFLAGLAIGNGTFFHECSPLPPPYKRRKG